MQDVICKFIAEQSKKHHDERENIVKSGPVIPLFKKGDRKNTIIEEYVWYR